MTAEFPEKITTQLKTAVNNLLMTLTDDVGENDDEIFVQATAGAPASGSFHIENEIIFYPTKTSLKFGPGLTRGADGTTKAVHTKKAEGGEIKFGPEAHFINNLNDELIATQTALGITGAFNFANYGKNLIPNHAFVDCNGDNLPDFWALVNTPTLAIATDTLFPARGGNQITITRTGGANDEGIKIIGGATNWLKVLPSTKYTISFDYKVTDGDFLWLRISSYNGDVEGTMHLSISSLGSTTAIRYSYTFTTDADADNLQIQVSAKNDGDIVIVSHPKLEQGANATPYIEISALTNKRIVKRVAIIASSATPTPAGDTTDIFTVTALAEAAEFAAPTGTPQNGQTLLIRIKDNGTARALTWNAIYRDGTEVDLPTTTVISKTIYIFFIYNSTDTKWDLIDYRDGI